VNGARQPGDNNERASRWTRRGLLGLTGALGAAAASGSLADAARNAGLMAGGDLERAVRLNPPEPSPPPGSYTPGSLYVALYGHPGSRTLGVLGEQGPDASVARARQVADQYVGLGGPVVPTFEILATVASEFAGSDGDYSNEFPSSKFTPWIAAAAANKFHVVLDLQSGRARFPDQLQEIETLLAEPHVSLALDPEWRVTSGRPGGGRVGTVDAAEVNEAVQLLDALIRRRGLPPKMLIIHQFTPSMITNKLAIRGTANVQVVFHMDGFGSLTLKRGSYARVVADLPEGALTGWKNFYDEDRPTPTPAQTLDNEPRPMFVSYQ
jgi:hypothetical protein